MLKENYLPRILTGEERKSLIDDILVKTRERVEKTGTQPTYITEVDIEQSRIFVSDGGRETIFNLQTRLIEGLYSIETFLIKDQLRRNGIRFRSAANGKAWAKMGKRSADLFLSHNFRSRVDFGRAQSESTTLVAGGSPLRL